MRNLLASAIVIAVLVAAAPASAQVEGFVTGGLHRDVNREQFGGVGGGVLLTAKWLSVGAQGDAICSPPYVAGRFTLLAQGNVVDVAGVRPFVQIGRAYGELKGTMYGAGVDFRPGTSRLGIRASYQTFLAQMWSGEPRPQPSVNFGLIWR